MQKDEFAFIQSLISKKQHHSSLIKGIGDDAALFRQEDGFETVVSVDTMVEDIHFKKTTMRPFHVGYKALAVNLSDIAAMGGIPVFYLVSLAVPKNNWMKKNIETVTKGMAELAEEFKVDLIGGDTVSSNHDLVVSVTVIGKVEKHRYLLRSNAKHGDVVFVTGSLGASSAGLSLLLENGLHHGYNRKQQLLIQQHQMPRPQIAAGRLLAQKMCRIALNDISDGLASEANEIAEASQTTLVIELEKIPQHEALSGYDPDQIKQFVLFGGEDFQLIGTTARTDWNDIQRMFEKRSIQITEIGHVEAGKGEVYLASNGILEKLEKKGFNHFRTKE